MIVRNDPPGPAAPSVTQPLSRHLTGVPFLSPIRLRSRARVSWLELFFDLIFVAAVAQVAEPLREHYTLAGVLRFSLLFALIWWAWNGYTTFATRFESDDVVQRGLTVIQIFVVAAMAANARDSLDSRSSAGFAAAYAVLRLLLVAQYLRARHLPHARALATSYAAGHGAAAIVWLLSAVLPLPWRYVAWLVAAIVDFGTPWSFVHHSVRIPPEAAHLPERVGLFTLILLGEAVVAVMQGMESQEAWPLAAALSALLGMSLLFLLWWWYFDVIDATREQPIRSHEDALRLHAWSYAHFPLYVGIVVSGVGVQRLIAAAAKTALQPSDAMVPVVASALTALAMAAIAVTTGPHRVTTRGLSSRSLAIAALVIGAVAIVRPTSPLVVVAALTLATAGQAVCWNLRPAHRV